MHIEDIARVCHETNRGYCQAIGDNSQPPWDAAPQWQKESAISGVLHARDNPNAKPSDSHESWLAEKLAAGWKYGAVKDPEKKEHPCFVQYAQLPPEQRAKDAIFLAVARSLLMRDPLRTEDGSPRACPTCKRPPPGYEYVGAAIARSESDGPPPPAAASGGPQALADMGKV